MTVLKTLLQDPPLPEPEQMMPELGFIEDTESCAMQKQSGST